MSNVDNMLYENGWADVLLPEKTEGQRASENQEDATNVVANGFYVARVRTITLEAHGKCTLVLGEYTVEGIRTIKGEFPVTKGYRLPEAVIQSVVNENLGDALIIRIRDRQVEFCSLLR